MRQRLGPRARMAGLAGLLCSLAVLSSAGPPADAQTVGASGLPIPRFVSINAGEANLRTGPGQRYPVEWVYVRRHLPVEIIAEHDHWRRVRDWEGLEGWLHRSLLSGRRTVVVIGDAPQIMRSRARDDAAVVARLEPGVVARLLRCPAPAEQARGDWCTVEVDGYVGRLRRTSLWGVYLDEVVD